MLCEVALGLWKRPEEVGFPDPRKMPATKRAKNGYGCGPQELIPHWGLKRLSRNQSMKKV